MCAPVRDQNMQLCVHKVTCIHRYAWTKRAHTHTRAPTCLHTSTHTYTYTCVTCRSTRAHARACAHIRKYLHTQRYTYTHTHLNTYIRTYIHTYLLTYLLTYIHTYIHTYLLTYLHTYIHREREMHSYAGRQLDGVREEEKNETQDFQLVVHTVYIHSRANMVMF